MSLKQSVVIRSQFSHISHAGYGKTPGQFILGYISRPDATETLTPVNSEAKQRLDQFATRYLARNDATEQAIAKYEPANQLDNQLTDLDHQDGRSFGSDGISYSHQELLDRARHLQQLFDKGHTVQKVVISMTTAYAKQHGILDVNFQHYLKGDFKGHVDQLKLRQALNQGLTRMTKVGHYQKPFWLGAVQVDTNHLHAHVVIVDEGELSHSKRLATFKDGTVSERGKINTYEKDQFRQSFNLSLLDQRPLRSFHKQVDISRQDTVTRVQNLTQNQLTDNTQLQVLLASLPLNQSLWRAKSNAKIMRRPNALMDDYLDTLILKYDDQLGYSNTLDSIQQYAHYRTKASHGNPNMTKRLYQNGVIKVRDQMKNQVYQQLKDVVNTNPHLLSTDFMIENAKDPEALKEQIKYAFQHPDEVNNLNVALFAYRLTSYQQRLTQHQGQSDSYQQALTSFDEQANQFTVPDSAYAMRDYYVSESLFHRQATDKYRYFFKFSNPLDNQNQKQFQIPYQILSTEYTSLLRYGKHLQLWDDDNQPTYRDVPLSFQTDMKNYTQSLAKYSYKTWRAGFNRSDYVYNANDTQAEFYQMPTPDSIPQPPKAIPVAQLMTPEYFDQIKGVDLADVGYDFAPNANRHVSPLSRSTYHQTVQRRSQTTEAAQDFIQQTGQDHTDIDQLMASLLQQQRLSQLINQTQTLPIGFEENEETDFDKQRQFKSVDLDEANTLTRQQLRLIAEINQAAKGEFDVSPDAQLSSSPSNDGPEAPS